jgi:hypothetical protein
MKGNAMAIKEIPEANAEQVATAVAARPATAEDARERTRKEYGQYVAAEPIYFGNALGYNPGDAVGGEVVQAYGWAEGDAPKVVKSGSAAHRRLRESLGLPPLES